ncbi:MAG: hypothetical protein ACE5OS_07015 [Anaerolineae bacterium]
MDRSHLLELMKGWGYYPLPKSHPESPGYTGLLVAIRKQPTGEHFDPERLHLRLRDAEGHSQWQTSSWLQPLQDSDQVCPGPVTLHDRHNKRVHFFTFGGSIEVFSEPDVIVHVLRSPAPILELVERGETIPDQLAAETEVLIGEIEGKLDELDEEEFDLQQVQIDPLQLYVTALQFVLQRYTHTVALQKTYREFYDALRREKDWLVANGLWPATPPSFESLFSQCLVNA